MAPREVGQVAAGDTHVIVVHLPPGRLTSFRGLGWVALEAKADEHEARTRFHVLKPAFEGLKAEAVLMKAVVHHDMRIEGVRTLMSKDAEFWRLKAADIGIASREQIDEWQAAASELVALEQAEALAWRPALRKVETSKGPVWAVAATCAALAVGFWVAATLGFSTAPHEQPLRGNTIFLSDPRDPNFVFEYAVASDGSHTAIRRMTRDELQLASSTSPEHTNGIKKPKTLADGIDVFLRIRQ